MRLQGKRVKAKSAKNQLVAAWRALYDRSATKESWEAAHRWNYFEEVARKTIDDIRDKLAMKSAERVLDVGSGCGIVCQSLLDDGQKGIGVDLSENLLRRAGDFGVDRRKVALAQAEASRLPFADTSFDRVLCYSVFQCFPSNQHAKQVLNELIRVCRPGGIILVGDIFPRHCANPIRNLGRILIGGLRALRLRIRLLACPFSGVSAEEELSNRYVLRRLYSKCFFEKAIQGRNCDIELMPQQITGREMLRDRFDVRIIKGSESKTK